MTSTDGSTPLSSEASRLFRVYKTMGSMLVKRGYMIPKDLRELTPKSFVTKFGEQPSREAMTILVVRWDDCRPVEAMAITVAVPVTVYILVFNASSHTNNITEI